MTKTWKVELTQAEAEYLFELLAWRQQEYRDLNELPPTELEDLVNELKRQVTTQ